MMATTRYPAVGGLLARSLEVWNFESKLEMFTTGDQVNVYCFVLSHKNANIRALSPDSRQTIDENTFTQLYQI